MAEPPAKRKRFDMSETFVAIVGETKKTFIMHTAITTRSSDFFKAAMTREWKEGQEKEVTLPEADEDAFEGYLQWMYTGELSSPEVLSFISLSQFYVLGDFLGDFSFREAVLDGIIKKACEEGCFPTSTAIRIAWKETPKESPIRKLYLEIIAIPSSMKSRMEYITDFENKYPKAFICEFFQHFINSRGLDSFGVRSQERGRLLRECRRKITKQQAGGPGR